MNVIHFDISHLPESSPNLTLALGHFDGLHRGHQKLFVEASLNASGDAGALFFASPFGKGPYLSSVEDKLRYALSSRLDSIYVFHNDESLFALSAEEFIERILLPLGTKKVVVGEDFRFGKGRSGDANTLRKYFEVIVVPLLQENGTKISSSSIKEDIALGHVEKARESLGRSYEISGIVGHGYHNGSKIDYPTANLVTSFDYVLPRSGVYCGVIYVSGKAYRAMVNVGINPTVGKLLHPIVEVHILDYDEDCYDKKVYVAFLSFIREERKFASLEELKAQLKLDEAKIREILA